jgi:serine protease Do
LAGLHASAAKGTDKENILRYLVISLVFLCVMPAKAASTAQTLFATYQNSIFQIRLLELASGSKSSIGSGFQVSADGLLATNYHVIAAAAHKPEKYRMEYVDSAGNVGELKLVNLDVVHDLALVRLDSPLHTSFITLATSNSRQGDDLYSIGNPRDLGMTVVKGTYNGFLEASFYQRILFSGSINPGMSGGPTLNDDGGVVGINVATAGNQLSFLVPVERLAELLAQPALDRNEVKQRIEQQLLANQNAMIGALLNAKWPTIHLGEAALAGELTRFTRCWGNASDDKERLVDIVYTQCFGQDEIFLMENFSTSQVNYEFYWLTTEKLSPWQFYHRYQKDFAGTQAVNSPGKENVTEFKCHQDFVVAGGGNRNWNTVFCARQYLDYPALFDVLFIAAAVSESKNGLITHFTLSGVSNEMGTAFMRKFMEHVQWPSS